MGIRRPKLEVTLEKYRDFKPNDVIKGRVTVESSSAFEVQNLDVLLQCFETAEGHYDKSTLNAVRRKHSHTNRLYSYRQTLFPAEEAQAGEETPVSYGRRSPELPNKWRSRYTERHKIQGGTHIFELALKVPEGYPPSLYVNDSSGIRWSVSAELFSGGSHSPARQKSKSVDVYRDDTIEYVPNAVSANTSFSQITVYRDGYRNAPDLASGIIENPESGDLKVKENIEFTLFVPQVGLMQSPHPAHLRLSLNCPSIESIMVKDASVYLHRDTKMKLRKQSKRSDSNGDHYATHHEETHIYSRTLKLPCVEALKRVNNQLDAIVVGNRFGEHESWVSELFEVSHELVAEISVYSREKTSSSSETLKVSAPVVVRSPLASVVRIEPDSKQKEISGEQPPAVYTAPDAEETPPVYDFVEKSGLSHKSGLLDKSGPSGVSGVPEKSSIPSESGLPEKSGPPEKSRLPEKFGLLGVSGLPEKSGLPSKSALQMNPVFQTNPVLQTVFAPSETRAPPEPTPSDAKGDV